MTFKMALQLFKIIWQHKPHAVIVIFKCLTIRLFYRCSLLLLTWKVNKKKRMSLILTVPNFKEKHSLPHWMCVILTGMLLTNMTPCGLTTMKKWQKVRTFLTKISYLLVDCIIQCKTTKSQFSFKTTLWSEYSTNSIWCKTH